MKGGLTMAKKCWLDTIPVILSYEHNGVEITKEEYMNLLREERETWLKKHFSEQIKAS